MHAYAKTNQSTVSVSSHFVPAHLKNSVYVNKSTIKSVSYEREPLQTVFPLLVFDELKVLFVFLH